VAAYSIQFNLNEVQELTMRKKYFLGVLTASLLSAFSLFTYAQVAAVASGGGGRRLLYRHLLHRHLQIFRFLFNRLFNRLLRRLQM
jgi:hypothetical protein